jgi:hypothetical protein
MTWLKRSREGFGSIFARRRMKRQLGGDVVFRWNPDDLKVLLTLSVELLTG